MKVVHAKKQKSERQDESSKLQLKVNIATYKPINWQVMSWSFEKIAKWSPNCMTKAHNCKIECESQHILVGKGQNCRELLKRKVYEMCFWV